MLKLSVKSIATFAIALGLAGLNLKGDEAIAQKNNLPLVVATNSVTCGLTQEIAANTIDLKCLIEPGADPHLYQPKPEDSKAIEQAQLILYGGYNFESGLIKLIKATSNPVPKVAVHEIGVPKPQQLEEDGQTVTDPHVWHNAQNGIRIANAIADSLSKAFPNNTAKYTSNTKQLTGELKQIDTWIKSQIQTIPPGQRKLVTTHDAMGYYANAYGIPIEGALQGISTEERPTAARVAELVKDIRKSGVPTIFAEKTVNPQLIEAVAREAKVKVADRELYADGLGEPGTDGDTYPKMLVANTRTIVEGLGGSYAAFESAP
ncbi:MAG: Manganese ABC transporter substrate-binding lipoprotein [Chroococcidiopsis cubana SAG 39.79]|jgi:manganese/iron transport system substrate-binding protein|uniref:Periplasmic solute binding protein n=2 Tax=Chroococcidiopsis TaxID=54298 RepID=K9TVK0_CHRTP|nr:MULTISPECIES: zinc ABC transporter substrate-binding protein [Chroococcidiopsis]PSB49286.1 metal ABC transporter substrate-binding protein [Cyanosarcina cf. burmensis CCALA 770]AFY86847.1 periplasmic solute binding protein [Chroococcidiopsis thermalis PCC 7203]MDZ4874133.1 Manganese ABC transporter substrate-binding lipoprotein [Chroococcidiopsis cubana SAG 39.79]PSB60113.1 metal ABC transporter substrate-binding protein [Chroococcidiopsis cubana CCALA 043]RUT12285.1 manganese ABC transport